MGERKRVERFEDLIGSVERVIMTRATRVKGPPINREPFAELFTASYGLVSVGPYSQSSGLTAEIRHRNREQQHLSKEVKSMKEGRQD